MTKPSDFIMNTDYLTIAQASRLSPTTVTFPSQTFPTDSSGMHAFYLEREVSFPASAGSIERFYIQYDGVWNSASQLSGGGGYDYTISGSKQGWSLHLYRKNANTITARCDYTPPEQAQTTPSTPALTFQISAVSFKPPNVF